VSRVQNDGSVLSARIGRASFTRPRRGCSSTPLPLFACLRQSPTYSVFLLWYFCFQAAQLPDGQGKGNSKGHSSSNRGTLAPQGQRASSRVIDASCWVR
jgi:hypothetical protein